MTTKKRFSPAFRLEAMVLTLALLTLAACGGGGDGGGGGSSIEQTGTPLALEAGQVQIDLFFVAINHLLFCAALSSPVRSLVQCCMLDGAFKTDAFGRVVRRKPQRYRGIARICNDTAGTKARF